MNEEKQTKKSPFSRTFYPLSLSYDLSLPSGTFFLSLRCVMELVLTNKWYLTKLITKAQNIKFSHTTVSSYFFYFFLLFYILFLSNYQVIQSGIDLHTMYVIHSQLSYRKLNNFCFRFRNSTTLYICTLSGRDNTQVLLIYIYIYSLNILYILLLIVC